MAVNQLPDAPTPGCTQPMTPTFYTPEPEQLTALAERLSRWQVDPWAGQLHPGDLGWHSSVGAEQMARDLRVWEQDGEPAAIGMLDGSDVLRMCVTPPHGCSGLRPGRMHRR